jgi:hypothetical protein
MTATTTSDPAATVAAAAPRTAGGWWTTFLELFALAGLAFTQPALDVLGKNAELFVTRRASGATTLALVAIALFAVPLAAFALELLVAAVRPTARRPFHLALCGLLVGVVAMEVLHRTTPLTLPRVLPLALAAAIGGAWLVRFEVVRQVLHVLAIAPLAFAALFLVDSDVSGAVWSSPPPVRPAEVTTPHRVVLVVLDEFPVESLLDGRGAVDRELYPAFADLADHATWYRNTTTVSGFTQEAVPAILTGRFPSGEATLPTSSEYPRNLFTLFGTRRGLNVHEALTHLCPPDLCRSSASGLGELVADTGSLWADFAVPGHEATFDQNLDQAAVALQTADGFVRSLRRDPGPGIDFVHIEIPHLPWDRIQSLATYDVPFEPPGESFVFNPVGPGSRSSQQRHLLQVQATDTIVGQILDRLRANGTYDDAMVVVTADHGISFLPDTPKRSPTAANLGPIAWTPLFVKYPGQQAGEVDDRRASSVDVAPTVAEVLGARGDLAFDGRSLLGTPRAAERRRFYVGTDGVPAGDLRPRRGRAYVHLDGDVRFPPILRTLAAPAGGDPDLRIYRRDPYGGLVGRAVTDLRVGPPARATVRLPALSGLQHAAPPRGPRIAWLWQEGTLAPTTAARWLAIALDGRIVAAVPTLAPESATAPFTFLVPPALVTDGRHRVDAYLVSGPPSSLRLEPVTVRR